MVNLVRLLKTWRDMAKTNRQKYCAMKKQYKKCRVLKELSPGKFVYMNCPFLDVKYQGIKQLNIPYRGTFLVLEVVDNRLCRLARVSDLVELPRLVAISRLKMTNLGLDPLEFQEDEFLNQDNYGEWIPHEDEIGIHNLAPMTLPNPNHLMIKTRRINPELIRKMRVSQLVMTQSPQIRDLIKIRSQGIPSQGQASRESPMMRKMASLQIMLGMTIRRMMPVRKGRMQQMRIEMLRKMTA